MNEMGGIYAKVASVGKAQNDVLRQVAERGIPIYQALASQLGVTTDEVFTLASEGKIGFEQFQQAMTSAAGTVAHEMGNTVGGSWANLMASLGRVGAGAMGGLFPKIAPLLQALTHALGPLEAIAAEAGAALGDLVGPWIDRLTTWVANVDFYEVAAGIKEFYRGAVDVKDLLLTGFTENETLLPPGVVTGLQIAHDIFAGIGDAIKGMWSALTGGDAASAEGSFRGIGDALTTLKPVFVELGEAGPKIGAALGDVARGGVDILAGALGFLADHIDVIVAWMPAIVAAAIAWNIASRAAAGSSLSLRAAELAALPVYAANNVMRYTSAKIERDLFLAKAATTGVQNAQTTALARGTIATIAHSTAARVAAAGQWLLNAAMSANPIGLIIAAIVAVVAAFVWFFTQTELGREIWANVTQAIATAATWLWETVLQPVFHAIGVVFTWIWENIILPIGTLIVNYFRFWGAVAVWLWKTVLEPVFGAIGVVFTWIWENIISPIVGFIALSLQGLGLVFSWLYENIIKPVWEGISSAIGAAWNWIEQWVFVPFKIGIGLIGEAFSNVAAGIATAWEGIKRAAAVPINFVLDTVWNNGLRSFWNGMVEELGLSDMKLPKAQLIRFARGGVLPGYTPGRDVHRFYSPTAGIQLALSGGEGILIPQATRALGGAAGIDGINAAARRGQLGVGDGIGDFFGDVWENIQKAAAVAWDFLSDPAGAIEKHVIQGILQPMMGGQNIFGQTVGGLAANTLRGFTDLFKAAAPKVQGGAGMGWEKMWAIVSGKFPWATLNDALRPGGTRSSSGSMSYHGMGRAIDTTASMEIFNWLASAFPGSSELIYSPAGARQLLNGRPYTYGEPVRSQHFSHVHWAMRHGGVLPQLYDQGGWMPHGGIGMNLSGRPERVLSPEESERYERGSSIEVTFVNPVVRDLQADAWEAAQLIGSVPR
jgi:tape measure domain-containing protein